MFGFVVIFSLTILSTLASFIPRGFNDHRNFQHGYEQKSFRHMEDCLLRASENYSGSRLRRSSGSSDDSFKDFRTNSDLEARCLQLLPWYYFFKPADNSRSNSREPYLNSDEIIITENMRSSGSRRPPARARPPPIVIPRNKLSH